MKLFLSFLLGLLLISCDKGFEVVLDPNPCPENGLTQAVLIRKGCEAFVFRLIVFSPDAQAEWTDIFTKKSYQNVISVLNYCSEGQEAKDLQALNTGELVTLKLTPTKDRCLIYCFAFEDAPKPTYNASDIVRCL